jgi:carbon storage regulator
MLVLSRKLSESVLIDAEIRVTVVSIGKGRVKLGISPPDHVRIIRYELLDHGPDTAVRQEETSPEPAEV